MGRSKLFDQLAVLQAEIEELRTRHSEAVEQQEVFQLLVVLQMVV
jgi:hypothetical protein